MFDPADPAARKTILAETGGKVMVTGLIGGTFSTPLPLPRGSGRPEHVRKADIG
ncbi:MAG TPA: hypothetical protein VHA77_03405 [Xanthobacteraceae bacterium]|nr:hypothetical protein [Xanthobacteraceae bacterium]